MTEGAAPAQELVVMVGLQGAGKSSWRKDLPAPHHSHARGGTLQAGRAGVPVRAVWLDVPLEVCRQRNEARTGAARVPDVGLYSAAARLVPPSTAEGFTSVQVVAD